MTNKAKLMACLMALSVAFAGYLSCLLAAHIDWHFGLMTAPSILPGISFGLATAGWLLPRGWVSRRKAVALVAGSAVAYFAAFWTAFFTIAWFGKGMILAAFRLPFFHAGMIGGVVGTCLLAASLAALSSGFRRKGWKTLIVIGTGAGGALVLTGVGAGSGGPGSLANPGDRVFIFVWQLLVSGYIGMLLWAEPTPSAPAPRSRFHYRAALAVLALLLLSFFQAAIGYARRDKETSTFSSAPSDSSNANTAGDAQEWANRYRNARFLTRAEFLKNVGPVHLVVRPNAAASESVPNLESIVRELAARHGIAIASGPTDVQLVVDAELDRSKITTTEYTNWGPKDTGYHMAYTTSVRLLFALKAKCHRGDKFVDLEVYPCRASNWYYGYMGDLVDFNATYAKGFREALEGVFDFFAKLKDADDTDNQRAWQASLWPRANDSAMQKSFLAPVRAEAGGSNHVFLGVTKFALEDVTLEEDAGKEFDQTSLQRNWRSELSRNGHEADPSADLIIRHAITINNLSRGVLLGGTVCSFDESSIGVVQRNVVFPFKGELRRADSRIWMDRDSTIALPRDNSAAAQDLVNRTIKAAAKEFALRR